MYLASACVAQFYSPPPNRHLLFSLPLVPPSLLLASALSLSLLPLEPLPVSLSALGQSHTSDDTSN